MVFGKHCKVMKCYEKAKVKLVFHFDHSRAAEIPHALVALGGGVKHGKGPHWRPRARC